MTDRLYYCIVVFRIISTGRVLNNGRRHSGSRHFLFQRGSHVALFQKSTSRLTREQIQEQGI